MFRCVLFLLKMKTFLFCVKIQQFSGTHEDCNNKRPSQSIYFYFNNVTLQVQINYYSLLLPIKLLLRFQKTFIIITTYLVVRWCHQFKLPFSFRFIFDFFQGWLDKMFIKIFKESFSLRIQINLLQEESLVSFLVGIKLAIHWSNVSRVGTMCNSGKVRSWNLFDNNFSDFPSTFCKIEKISYKL